MIGGSPSRDRRRQIVEWDLREGILNPLPKDLLQWSGVYILDIKSISQVKPGVPGRNPAIEARPTPKRLIGSL